MGNSAGNPEINSGQVYCQVNMKKTKLCKTKRK